MKATLRRVANPVTPTAPASTEVIPPEEKNQAAETAKPAKAREVAEPPKSEVPVEEPANPTNDGFADELLSGAGETVTGPITGTAEGDAAEDAGGITQSQPADRGNSQVAVVTPDHDYTSAAGGAIEGEFDVSDIRLPRLLVVNGNGKMSESYNQGDVVLADQLLFAPGKAAERYGKIRVIPVHLKKQWRQNLTQEEAAAGLRSIVVDTKAEAEEYGGATEWHGSERPRWSPSGRIMFLVEKPKTLEEDHPAFSIALGDQEFAACVYYASGGSYGPTFNQIFNTAQWGLRDPKDKRKILLWLKYWALDFGKVKAGEYMVYRPSAKVLTERTSEDIWELASTIAGVRAEQVESDEA